jgi:hypothetical protein
MAYFVGDKPMAQKALYYPYIHIRHVDWLKGTLLLFSQVRRMVPGYEPGDDATPVPGDDDLLSGFMKDFKGGGPLLTRANLSSQRVKDAQRWLATKLEKDTQDPEFLRIFGKESTRRFLNSDDPGFPLHIGKLVHQLYGVLGTSQLAWPPNLLTGEPYDQFGIYVEVHPSVGEVVMSTLAIACADAEGLYIVGDERSGRLHSSLLEQQKESIYQTWLPPAPELSRPEAATPEELFEFMIGFARNLSDVTPDKLASMRTDREALRNLLTNLRERAALIPSMDPGPESEEYFEDTVSDVIKQWHRDRSNMARFWRHFFEEGLIDPSADFLTNVAEKTVEASQTAAVSAVPVLTLAHLAPAELVAGAGLSVAMLVHAGKSYLRMHKREHERNYRYLTIMDKAGVVFRSDVGLAS